MTSAQLCRCPRGTAIGNALDHNSHAMQYVNTAAALQLVVRSVVVVGTARRAAARSGDLNQSGLAPEPADFDKVTFTTPAGTTTVTATDWATFDGSVPSNPGLYAAHADVTTLATASGTYSVADIQTSIGAASFEVGRSSSSTTTMRSPSVS